MTYYIRQRDDFHAKVRAITSYDTLDELVRKEWFGWSTIRSKRSDFAESVDVRIANETIYKNYLADGIDSLVFYNYAKVVYDENENVVPICELNRVYNEVYDRRFNRPWRWRRSRQPYGGWRRPHTTQEKRQYYAAMDEEYPIRVRGRRKPRSLADVYDDYYAHADKSWKTQSKRSHQWK